MRKATRLLIAARPKSKLITVREEIRPDAEPNMCVTNAVLLTRSDQRYFLAGGWIVGGYIRERGTAAMPHMWVLDAADESHVDITPQLVPPDPPFEYVRDEGIIDCWLETGKLPPAIRIWDGPRFEARIGPSSFIGLSDLDAQTLVSLARSTPAALPVP